MWPGAATKARCDRTLPILLHVGVGLGLLTQVQIEEDILAKAKVAAGWAQRLVKRLNPGEREGWPPGTDKERRDRDM